MKRKNSTRRTWLIVAAVALLIGGATLVNQLGRQSIALRDAQIPEETKRYLRELGSSGGDIAARLVEDPIADRWRDDTNEGEDASNGFYKLEDANFI